MMQTKQPSLRAGARATAWLLGATLSLTLTLSGCASAPPPTNVPPTPPAPLLAEHPLVDQIWDVRAQAFIPVDELYRRAAAARHVLLGETHDSVAHHARQLRVMQALTARGLRPALAMEQFDTEHQAALAQAQQSGEPDAEHMAERLADAGQLNRKGWRWPLYKDLIDWAARHRWPLHAANLSRQEGRRIAMGQASPVLQPIAPAQQALMEADVVQGHCGHRPEAAHLSGMVKAQRARDERMAQSLQAIDGPAVLIAGLGHVRTDRAVPRYLSPAQPTLAIGLMEVRAGQTRASDYPTEGLDLVWFTPAQQRPDPCAQPLPFKTPTTPKKEVP